MSNVIRVDFGAKPSASPTTLADVVRKQFLTNLSEAGFHQIVAERAADKMTSTTMRFVNDLDAHRTFTLSVSIDATLDAENAARAAVEQMSAQVEERIRAALDAAVVGITAAATCACLVMAHSDQLA